MIVFHVRSLAKLAARGKGAWGIVERRKARHLVNSYLVNRPLVTRVVQTKTKAFGVEPRKLILNDKVYKAHQRAYALSVKNDRFHSDTPGTASQQMLSLI